MDAAQHKLTWRALLAGARRRHPNESDDASDGFARLALAPRRPALRGSSPKRGLLRAAFLRLGASG